MRTSTPPYARILLAALAAPLLFIPLGCSGDVPEPDSEGDTGGGPSGGSASIDPTPTAPGSTPSEPSATGAVATWRVARGTMIDTDMDAFTAEVTRLDCNSGVTGEVFAPTVVETDDRVVVTFAVAPSARLPVTCQGNALVPADVRLEAPIGDRVLVDGACEPGGGAESTGFCNRDGVRFRG
ncbi:hypothetical protein KLP28_09050 [Nocardioidaceae bacterium]|nr:hypothetical protein KLP28_09050 [Nocardioidaceae bacterium]